MADWLQDVRDHCEKNAPELLLLFDIYAAEAAFGRSYISADSALLKPGARIIEVGAGTFLLSCQLAREGFEVTALEPTGSGFSHFQQLRQLVRDRAEFLGCLPRVIGFPAEVLSEKNCFDFAFSVNVMEHVNDIPRVMANIAASLAPGASYRFTCPNYLFPYEPHFNIPTLFSKKLTEKAFHRRIFKAKSMPDPAGMWQSLNWIDVLKVWRVARGLAGISATFNRSLLVSTLERIAIDEDFASRRSPAMRSLLLLLVRLRLHRLFQFVPAIFQPIMDCRLKKTNTQG
ncbi:MAG: methyltransferase domain-containing protein [Polaromonas sp.]|uniref:class I SAM-dependent methyltransferase n=1 Tax=Polaromonas sp. TaxID=1869339 RepID=UPI002731B152|nr:methyltransferase domain-containing protein [Polaromonas sp.]MDP2452355.1 methyltransferase domain-containing protein [Polaromonas sp.]MDP3248964.1 methyltransferase domain-containing protein [Polaromonas sp.]MDP3755946.1 methyltransferase domain-containing protein [Polaromonas sp.]